MENNLSQAKKSLFSHADPSLAIKEMKTMNSHLLQTRDLLHQTVDLMSNVKVGVSNTSSNLSGTSSMYDNYGDKLRSSSLYVGHLKQKEEENARKVKLSFGFFIAVVIFIIVKRILFPAFYRDLFEKI
jgi:hypothetical protein